MYWLYLKQHLHCLLNTNLFNCLGRNPIRTMAKSRFEYVRQFETPDSCLQNCWIVVRVDGKNFHKFSVKHHFIKPNDDRSLSLMTHAAKAVMVDFRDVVLAYGQSDEYSFVFKKQSQTYNRRASKLMSNVVSLFTSTFVFHWPQFFPTQDLLYPPSFDSRVVLYPSEQNLRDYLSWRQADCHINNMYNTCFWALIQQGGMTPQQAEQKLKGTLSGEKNELLFSQFSINYNDLPQLYRKGTVLVRQQVQVAETEATATASDNLDHITNSNNKPKTKHEISVLHVDIIGKEFWKEHPKIMPEGR